MDGHRARRRFGQNFLVDAEVIERTIAAIGLAADDRVVEIGPGLGALTKPLAARLDRLTVIEVDRDLAGRLRRSHLAGLEVIEQDALAFDFAGFAAREPAPVRIVGNLPYNVGTPLLQRFVPLTGALRDIHVMLQREVVERLAARPGSRDWGRLGVLMQAHFDVVPLFEVPPEAFSPAPKVRSTVVRLIPIERPTEAVDADMLSDATRLAFQSRRKTLRNNLRGELDDAALGALDLDPNARPETIDLAGFERLARALASRNG